MACSVLQQELRMKPKTIHMSEYFESTNHHSNKYAVLISKSLISNSLSG
jgi:hypothetical protein